MIQVFIHLHTQTAIVKFCMQSLTWQFIFADLTKEKYDITDKGTMNLLEEQFMNSIDRDHLVTWK